MAYYPLFSLKGTSYGKHRVISVPMFAEYEMNRLFLGKMKPFVKDDRGATMTEYAIVVGLIAIVAITAVTLFQGSLTAAFNNLASKTGNYTTSSTPGG